MQFKHPEILWALFLLLIPIVIHFFQLRRFKKTPFTNVAMLQKVVTESRKSNNLKKWLLLFTRLLLLSALIIAFAQPFFANNTALRKKEMVIYLDNSFSMQAKKDGLSLMEKAIQDLVKTIPSKTKFSFFTNSTTYKNVQLQNIQNNLLGLNHTSKQLAFNEILLKSKTLFSKSSSSQKNLILISDFQTRVGEIKSESSENIQLNLVDLKPDNTNNIAIDSIFLSKSINNQIELTALISGVQEEENIPISLYNGNQLIAKTAAIHSPNTEAKAFFSLPNNKDIKGRITLTDNSLTFDNDFYFNIDENEKIKALAIGDANAGFLKRIYTSNEFEFKSTALKNLDYSEINNQNLIVLNELNSIPTSLQTILKSFYDKGGSMVIIPAKEIDLGSYNSILSNILQFRFTQESKSEQKITSITFDHPLFNNVFEKRVSNFDYPKTNSHWTCSTNAASVLSFSNSDPFLIARDNLYVFTASLDKENSNFKNSPLIVPTFYNMGANSLKTPDLYLTIGNNSTIDLPLKLERDKVIKVANDLVEFIPLQQAFSNKISLTFSENPDKPGIYGLLKDLDTIKKISFNHPRTEGLLNYSQLNHVNPNTVTKNIPDLFDKMAKDNTITEYWKWFVIFALVFALVEVLIQKFLA